MNIFLENSADMIFQCLLFIHLEAVCCHSQKISNHIKYEIKIRFFPLSWCYDYTFSSKCSHKWRISVRLSLTCIPLLLFCWCRCSHLPFAVSSGVLGHTVQIRQVPVWVWKLLWCCGISLLLPCSGKLKSCHRLWTLVTSINVCDYLPLFTSLNRAPLVFYCPCLYTGSSRLWLIKTERYIMINRLL